jgi:regulator of sirC expression with transglutaminase-like and TPR domain
MALLVLGRWREALASYEAALALNPDSPPSIYGRGIARQRACNCSDGSIDLDAAVRRDAGVAQLFANAGLAP